MSWRDAGKISEPVHQRGDVTAIDGAVGQSVCSQVEARKPNWIDGCHVRIMQLPIENRPPSG